MVVIVAMAILFVNPVVPLWLKAVSIGVVAAALVDINIYYVKAVRQQASEPSCRP